MKKKILLIIPILIILIGIFFINKNNNIIELESKNIKKLASYEDVLEEDKKIDGSQFVKFDAFFLIDKNNDGIADPIRGNSININKTGELWIELKVEGESILKDANIEFINNNVRLSYSGRIFDNTINTTNLTEIPVKKEIENGNTIIFKVGVKPLLNNDINSYNAINKVKIKGTVVENGKNTNIEKEVSYRIDWYQTSLFAQIPSDYKASSTSELVNSDKDIKVNYEFKTLSDVSNLLKSVNLKISIPSLNGIEPINATITGTNVTYNFDKKTGILTAKREAELKNTMIYNACYDYVDNDYAVNNFKVEVLYPSIAGSNDATASINIEAFYELYNNQDDDYEKIILSNKANRILMTKYDGVYDDTPIELFTNVLIGNKSSSLQKYYINKTPVINLYNGIEDDDTEYKVIWNTKVKYKTGKISKIEITDVESDKFNNNVSMIDYTVYSKIKFDHPELVLSDAGYIKMYNAETNELIHVFTKSDFNDYYIFNTDVRRIFLETSEIININYKDGYQDLLKTEIIKKIDNKTLKNKYEKKDFDDFKYITSQTKTNCIYNNEQYNEKSTQTASAEYITYKSSEIKLSTNIENKKLLTNGVKNIKMYLSTGSQDDIVTGWKNGEFIIAIPKDILNIKINNVSINNSNIKILGYEVEELNDVNLIKILTSNEENDSYTITLDLEILPDPRSASKNIYINAYGLNRYSDLSRTTSKDIYDIDNDGNKVEYVNSASDTIKLEVSNEVITTTVIKTYDILNNEIVKVSPQLTEVSPLKNKTKAQIEIGLTNNSEDKIKEIEVVGKVGYIGNKYQIGNGLLGSEYDVTMSNTGISIPNSIIDKVKIYYSDKEEPTRDVNLESNNWKQKEDISDFTKVKSYMIKIDDYSLSIGDNLVFEYEIVIPNNSININKTTYFTHGVYYTIETNNGNYNSSVSGSKSGIKIVRKYDLAITNMKLFQDRVIPNSIYTLEGNNGTKIIKLDNNGNAIVNDLYVGEEYILKQTMVNYPYLLDEEEKKFKLNVNSSDLLEIDNQIVGTYKDKKIEDETLKLVLENETRYTVKITNTDLDTNKLVPGSKYKLIGKGYENGKTFITNEDGEITIEGLYLENEYTLSQESAIDYLEMNDPITFKLKRFEDGVISPTYVGEIPFLGDTFNLLEGSKSDYSYSFNTSANNGEDNIDFDGSNPVKGYFDVDLLGRLGTFKIQYRWDKYGNNNCGYTNIVLVTDINHLPPLKNYCTTGGTFTITTAYDYDSVTKTFNEIPITGGRKYYLYLDGYKTNNNYGYIYYYIQRLQTIDGNMSPTVKYLNLENLPHHQNKNILQTFNDSKNYDAPIYHLNIKSKAIPKYTLELTKKDADTKQVLKNAQFRITGPGLPVNGQIITTDDFGIATVELDKRVLIDYKINNKYHTELDGIDYSKSKGLYKIEEIVPPIGYSINKEPINFEIIEKNTNLNCSTNWNNLINKEEAKCSTKVDSIKENILSYPDSNNHEFNEVVYDDDTDTLKVVIHDYPLVSIIKKDLETDELLPNTLFAIYSISYSNIDNSEVLIPAKDSKNKVIGDKLLIDNKEYYVLATDEKGKISLDLPAGNYKAIEVQASNDKYSLDNNEYYFSVGDTRLAQDGKIVLSNSINIDNFFYIYYYNGPYSDIQPTKDGGWIAAARDDRRLIKFDANANIEWESDTTIYARDSITQYRYYDDPDKFMNEYNSELEPQTSGGDSHLNTTVIEVEDGYYVLIHELGAIKFDKNGNRLWQNHDYNKLYLTYYTAVCDKQTGKLINDNEYVNESNIFAYDANNPYIQRDNDTYYCSTSPVYDKTLQAAGGIISLDPSETGNLSDYMKYIDTSYSQNYNYETNKVDYIPMIEQYNNELRRARVSQSDNINWDLMKNITSMTTTKNGGMLLLTTDALTWSPSGVYMLSNGKIYNYNGDGTRYRRTKENNMGELLITDGSGTYDDRRAQKLAYYDKNGKLLALYNLREVVYEAYKMLGYDYNIQGFPYRTWNTSDSIHTFENGDILYFSSLNGIMRLKLNEETLKYEIVYFIEPNSNELIKDNNGNDIGTIYSILHSGENMTTHKDIRVLGNDFTYFIYDLEGNFKPVYIFDKTGKVTLDTYLTNVDGVNYTAPLNHEGRNFSYVKLDNGNYFVMAQIVDTYNARSSYLNSPIITLADGTQEYVGLDQDSWVGDSPHYLLVYELNEEGKVLWYKIYKGLSLMYDGESNSSWPYSIAKLSLNGKKILMPTSAHKGDVLENIKDSDDKIKLKGKLLIFDVLDKERPEMPEAYNIEIKNARKIFNINVDSKNNGRVEVLNDNNLVTTVINENKKVENIKYGDTSIYRYKAIPDIGYAIDKVYVNDIEYPYIASLDGTIILDTFKEINENKEIKITYKPATSYVIVRHYKDKTTERIASDEIISGLVLTLYTTEPVSHDLYSLIKENDEYVLPNNMIGLFMDDPIEVIYYYEKNNVKLKVNYYKDNTTIKLADELIETKVLGSNYKTKPKNIEFYSLTKVIGEEEGILNKNLTEVTYMYKENNNSKIIVKYLEKDTDKELASEELSLKRNDTYTTDEKKFDDYKLVSKTDNYKGIADKENIEVIYYYVKKESKIIAKYIDKETNNEIDLKEEQIVKFKDYYQTTKKTIENYVFIESTNNTKGQALQDEIIVIYYYQRIKENPLPPDTGDNIDKYIVTSIISIITLVISILFLKIKKHKEL